MTGEESKVERKGGGEGGEKDKHITRMKMKRMERGGKEEGSGV